MNIKTIEHEINSFILILTLRRMFIFSDEPTVVEQVGHNRLVDVVNMF